MDLDKLPHFGSGAASVPPPPGELRRGSVASTTSELARLSTGVAKQRSARGSDGRLPLPHSSAPVPSYVEEIQDLKHMFKKEARA
jgi:hypothetical protein